MDKIFILANLNDVVMIIAYEPGRSRAKLLIILGPFPNLSLPSCHGLELCHHRHRNVKTLFLLTYSRGLSLGEEKSLNGPLAKRGSWEDRRFTELGAKTDPQSVPQKCKTKESRCVSS